MSRSPEMILLYCIDYDFRIHPKSAAMCRCHHGRQSPFCARARVAADRGTQTRLSKGQRGYELVPGRRYQISGVVWILHGELEPCAGRSVVSHGPGQDAYLYRGRRTPEGTYCLRFIGDIDRFGQEMADKARDIEAHNPTEPTGTLVLALSYGGRLEILTAVNDLILKGATTPISEEIFAQHLWTAGIPDPDIIIRVGGEKRLSNFLTWQSIYSELFFSGTLWPAFTREEFLTILDEYGNRERRMGR